MSTQKKSTKKTDDLNHAQASTSSTKVVLKSKFGIPPIVYIPILYGSIILILIVGGMFFSLTKKNGQTFKITTIPPNAAVFIDDTYVGYSPIKTRIKKGSHTLVVSLPFYTSHTESITAKNPILKLIATKRKTYTLIPEVPALPIRENESVNISDIVTQNEAKNLIEYTIQNLASWNISNTRDERHHIPPILKDAFSALESIRAHIIDSPHTPENDAVLENITHLMFLLLYESMPYLANNTDAISIQSNKIWIEEYEKLSQSVLFTDYSKKYASDTGFVYKKTQVEKFYQLKTQYTAPSFNLNIPPSFPVTAPSTLRIDTIPFTLITPQTLRYADTRLLEAGSQDPIQTYMEVIIQDQAKTTISSPLTNIETPSFYIMNREITQADFGAFLDDNDMSIEAWKTLSDKNISDDYKEYHFFDFNPSRTPHRPLRYITWYDAYAFVVWFNTAHQLKGYRAKLPNEFEWNAAITLYRQSGVLDKEGDYIPKNYIGTIPQLLGNLWEWGDNWYSPAPHYAGYDGASYGSEKNIFGGSYITKKSQKIGKIPLYISRNTAAPPNWANEFIGFRLVLRATSSE